MNHKNTLSITEARKKIFDIAEDVQKPGVYYTLTENGRPKAVFMSAGEFESWKETMEVMKIFPDLDKDVAEAERDYQKGDYVTLEELLAKDGFVLAEKPKNKYELPGHPAKKGAKRPKKSR
jgi:prevent-host-death family protein